jgi:hypothetical protein
MENICNMPECNEKSNIQQIGSDVKEIKDALLGNPYNNNQGLLFKVNEHDKLIKQMKGKMIFLSGVFSVVSFTVGFLLDKLFEK